MADQPTLPPEREPAPSRWRVPTPHGVIPPRVRGIGAVALMLFLLTVIFFSSATTPAKPRTVTSMGLTGAPADAAPRLPPSMLDLAEPPVQRLRDDPAPSPRPPVSSSGGASAAPSLTQARARAREASLASPTLVVSREARPGAPRLSDASLATAAYEEAARTLQRSSAPPPAREALAPRALKRTPPLDDSGDTHTLLEYTVFDTILTHTVNGTGDSPLNVMVNVPVYSFTRNVVVIPAGARILGRAKAVSTYGQARLTVQFHRIVYPDGSTIDLDEATSGLENAGDLGLKGKVNHHYAAMFGAAAAVGLISGFSQAVGSVGYSGGDGNNRTEIMVSGVGQSTAQAASSIISRFTNRLPDVELPVGHLVKVILMADLDLPEWHE